MLRTLLPLGAIVAVAVAGCASRTTSNDSSGKFRGDQRLVANTIEDFESAASKGDQDQICRDLLARPLAVRYTERGGTCEHAVDAALKDTDSFGLTVESVRNWLYVEDFARGIGHVLEHGVPGEAYNVGGPDECPNIEVVKGILEYTGAGDELIEYVTDRPGHDRRYSLGSEKVRALGWEAQVRFADGLQRTVDWYRDNEWWWEPIRSGDYRAYYERQYGRALG